jgi:methionyl-tRNA formyltransferase
VRVFLCGNGPSAVEIARYLAARPEDALVGCALHPPERARDAEALRAICGAPVIVGPEINQPRGLALLREASPDVLLSVHFGYLLRRAALQSAPRALNLHPALLPHGRGANPDVWAIVESTPAGVSLHEMSEEVDAGDVLAQCEVSVSVSDTAESLYRRLLEAEVRLFEEAWPRFASGELVGRRQPPGAAAHRRKDLERLDRLDPDEVTTVRALLDRLRARTFPPHDGCYLETEEGRVYFRLQPYRKPEERG